jgi:hypothetical protein
MNPEGKTTVTFCGSTAFNGTRTYFNGVYAEEAANLNNLITWISLYNVGCKVSFCSPLNKTGRPLT